MQELGKVLESGKGLCALTCSGSPGQELLYRFTGPKLELPFSPPVREQTNLHSAPILQLQHLARSVRQEPGGTLKSTEATKNLIRSWSS